jgi:hypothetical protein
MARGLPTLLSGQDISRECKVESWFRDETYQPTLLKAVEMDIGKENR